MIVAIIEYVIGPSVLDLPHRRSRDSNQQGIFSTCGIGFMQ